MDPGERSGPRCSHRVRCRGRHEDVSNPELDPLHGDRVVAMYRGRITRVGVSAAVGCDYEYARVRTGKCTGVC